MPGGPTIAAIEEPRLVSADEAMALGLLNEVVPASELRNAASELARELASGPQVSMRLLKRSLYQAGELSFEQACEEIASKTAISDHHPDTKEGVSAFREKRIPQFNEWLNQYE